MKLSNQLMHKYYLWVLKRILDGSLSDGKEIAKALFDAKEKLYSHINAYRTAEDANVRARFNKNTKLAESQYNQACSMATMLQSGSDSVRQMVEAFLNECQIEPEPLPCSPGYEFTKDGKLYRYIADNRVIPIECSGDGERISSDKESLTEVLSGCSIDFAEPIDYPLTDGVVLHFADHDGKRRQLQIVIADGYEANPNEYDGTPLQVLLSPPLE